MVQLFEKLSLKIQGILVFISIIFYGISSSILDKSYIASKFPVPYYIQQTCFDAIKMKNWYSFMQKEGTFEIYLNTQFIDFIFIFSVILSGFLLFLFQANLHQKHTFFYKYGQLFAYSLPFAGFFDILENIVSFFMIFNPKNFYDFIVIPYSTFAVIKFSFWFIGINWFIISTIFLIINMFHFSKKVAVTIALLLCISMVSFAQKAPTTPKNKGLIYVEADPFAYINKGYSTHLGYENWGLRFDLTKVKVDFPKSFEKKFYDTENFDLVSNISGIKIDYIGNRTDWTKGAFIGTDINYQKLHFKHRITGVKDDLSAFNVGLRAGYKINIYRGFYMTPWAAIWRNIASEKSFTVGEDKIHTNKTDWIVTLHFGYAIKL